MFRNLFHSNKEQFCIDRLGINLHTLRVLLIKTPNVCISSSFQSNALKF